MHRFFKGDFFNFETVRILGMTAHGGADVAEVLEAVGQIRDGDAASWGRAWKTQAERAEALAEEALRAGHIPLARQAFLRASNYTRASTYMFIGDGPDRLHPKQVEAGEKMTALFRKGAEMLDCGFRRFEIPYKEQADVTLPAYLYLPSADKRLPGGGKIPVLIACCGGDAPQEEIYYLHPSAGPDLGYAVLTFEGPGQGRVLRQDSIKMRPDWEVVTACVLDFLEGLARDRPEFELDMVKACIALDPFFSLWDFAMQRGTPAIVGAWDRGWISSGFIDGVLGLGMRLSFQMRWELSTAGTLFGLGSPARSMQEMKRYTLGGDTSPYLERIQCPVLVSGASDSLYFDPSHHSVRVLNGLKNVAEKEKELWLASTPGEGALQAKVGAFQLVNQKTFTFLDKRFGIERVVGGSNGHAARSGAADLS
ncbi:hypothetical protein N0V88_004941 [Collariella sp. IMI 366227]|nr:hypothetical protein N0V88_004941 [Collariella sp. IMI 366227]